MAELNSWDAKCAEIEDAFRALDIQQFDLEKGTSAELHIAGLGRYLLLMMPVEGIKKAKPKRGMTALENATARTIRAIEELSPIALEALNYKTAALRQLTSNLRILNVAAKTAELGRHEGAPIKHQAREIARVVGAHYYVLTGKKPTAPSVDGQYYDAAFIKLLKNIYHILGVKGSATSQAKTLAASWDSVDKSL